MAQMFTKRSILHLLFVLLCASPMSRASYVTVSEYSADGCAAADFISKKYEAHCSGMSGTWYAATCSGTTQTWKTYTDAECTTGETELGTADAAGECVSTSSGGWEVHTCETPPYIAAIEMFSTTDCSGTPSMTSAEMWDAECFNTGETPARSKKYSMSGGNFTKEEYPSTDCSGTSDASAKQTAFCDACTDTGAGSVMVTCTASSSVISGAPRVAPVPQLVGAPVLCMALLMKLLV